jgi:hypothetical protein
MHCFMLITLTMLPAETSEQARERAYNLLINDDSFCGEGGRFGSPLCDWFVIGGRWSGTLRRTLIGQPYQDAINDRFPKLAGWYSDRDLEPHRAALDALWHEFGGDGASPFNRSAYEEWGYSDDAMPVDKALYDRFLAAYTGQSDGEEDNAPGRFADLDGDSADESFIGRKWIIVIDYHS